MRGSWPSCRTTNIERGDLYEIRGSFGMEEGRVPSAAKADVPPGVSMDMADWFPAASAPLLARRTVCARNGLQRAVLTWPHGSVAIEILDCSCRCQCSILLDVLSSRVQRLQLVAARRRLRRSVCGNGGTCVCRFCHLPGIFAGLSLRQISVQVSISGQKKARRSKRRALEDKIKNQPYAFSDSAAGASPAGASAAGASSAGLSPPIF